MTHRELLAEQLANSWSNCEFTFAAFEQAAIQLFGARIWLATFISQAVDHGRLQQRRLHQREWQLFLESSKVWRKNRRALKQKTVPLFPNQAERLTTTPAASQSLPSLSSLADLAEWLKIDHHTLDWFADLRSWEETVAKETLRHYRYRWVRKRTGNIRLIEVPKAKLKAIQRKILHELLAAVPVHPAAHAFVPRHNILSYVRPHVGQALVLRLDLQEFFPSLVRRRIAGCFFRLGYPERVALCLAGLCTNATPPQILATNPANHSREQAWALHAMYRQPHLPQGAPTSPALANLCAFRLDARLSGLARVAGVQYTRYADDLLFSGNEMFARQARCFSTNVAAIIEDENFRVNYRKTRIMHRSARQFAAGMVINEHPNPKRQDFEQLKAILFNCRRRAPTAENRENIQNFREHLQGRIAHIHMIHSHKGEKLQQLLEQIQW